MSSFVMSMAPNRTSVSQCLQELISFLNTITGSCVPDFSSRGFLKDFFFKGRRQKSDIFLKLQIDWV